MNMTFIKNQEIFHNHVDNSARDNSEEMGMQGLWKAVIMQALVDAASNSKKKQVKANKLRALRWLKGDSDDFVTVCMLANMNPNHVKQQVRTALSNGCKWRSDPKIPSSGLDKYIFNGGLGIKK
ncbi:hypothetical protein MIDIC_20068 [Alphaproteobacteria bacterium]